jgi:hypothetical protein
MGQARAFGSLAVFLIAVAATSSRPASAADNADVTGELDALVRRADFDAAEARAETLLHSGSLTRAQAARAYLALGVVSSARRETEKAEVAFRRALMLDAGLPPPAGVGPHVAASFAKARAALGSLPPAAPPVTLTALPGAPSFRIETGRATDEGLARRFAVRVAGLREEHELGKERGELVVSLPTSVVGCATASVGLLDEHGNELWPAVASAEVCRRTAAGRPEAAGLDKALLAGERAHEKPAPKSRRAVWVTGAVTGGLLVATGVLGWVAVERRNEYHDSIDSGARLDEQRRLMEDASTAQHRATIGAIATGVMAAAMLIVYLVGRR